MGATKAKKATQTTSAFWALFQLPYSNYKIKRSEDLFFEVYRDGFLYINLAYQNINVSLNNDIHKYMNVTLNEKCPPGGELLC